MSRILRVAELAAAAGLANEAPVAFGRRGQRFLVSHLRLADAGLDAELALEAVDDDLEVQLAHAGDHDLAGLLVGADAEGRVFGHQLRHALAELFLVGLGLRLDGERDDRLRELHRSRMIGFFSSHSVSPVVTDFRPTAAAMSPA